MTTPRSPIAAALAAALCCIPATLAAQDGEPRQDPLQLATTKLHKWLQAMAALPSVAFTAQWGPDKAGKADDPVAVFITGNGGTSVGTLRGVSTTDLLHIAWEDGNEYLQAGRQALAKDGTTPWTPRRDKLADGSATGFLPDPQALFRVLQQCELPVLHRTADTLQDRPVEILGCTLTEEQAVTALYGGVLPGSSGGFSGVALRAIGGAGAPRRVVPNKPQATIDLAFFVDPATGQVHKLHVRCWLKSDVRMGAAGAFVVVGGGAARAAQEEEDDDDEEKIDPKAPLVYEQGLPVRPRKKMQVTDFVLTLQDFGTAKAPELDERTRALLGR